MTNLSSPRSFFSRSGQHPRVEVRENDIAAVKPEAAVLGVIHRIGFW